jgi:hypothetical protein
MKCPPRNPMIRAIAAVTIVFWSIFIQGLLWVWYARGPQDYS